MQLPVQFRDEAWHSFIPTLRNHKLSVCAVVLYRAQKLTALDFQSAVLLVQRVSPQIHHAGSSRRDSES